MFFIYSRLPTVDLYLVCPCARLTCHVVIKPTGISLVFEALDSLETRNIRSDL